MYLRGWLIYAFMKKTTATIAYESPEIREIEIAMIPVLCQSIMNIYNMDIDGEDGGNLFN